jgi:N-acetylglucosamine-6-phosphate deacetylase
MTEMMIAGPDIYTEEGIVPEGSITIRNGMIATISTISQTKRSSNQIIRFPSSYRLVPGFIDLHVHGANNQDIMDATQEALTLISQTLAREGTTAFLATTMTASPFEIEKALCAVRDYMQSQHKIPAAAMLGVHLEGPFISSKKAGAQRADDVLRPDSRYIAEWQEKSGQAIKLVTLAPELPNSLELIRYLRQHNIIASIGHTDAAYTEAKEAIQEGCHYVTHLFNAMRGIHQREPGVVTAALLAEKVKAELIVDGHHLHPAILELVLKLKGVDDLVLVTDAMRAKCLGNGRYDLGGQAVQVESNIARLADGTLAGSTLRMPEAICNMVHYTHCDFYDAVKMASANPAKVLGIFEKKGSIALGKEADLVVLDDHLQVVMTVVGGRIVYQRFSFRERPLPV